MSHGSRCLVLGRWRCQACQRPELLHACHAPVVRRYTALMRKEIEGNPCERNGVDQGMHNVFVHGRRLAGSEVVILTNEEGPIATVQSMKKLHRDKYGRLLNRDGGYAARTFWAPCTW